MENNYVRITPEGVVYQKCDTQEAWDTFTQEPKGMDVYALHDDGSESLIENENDFDKTKEYGMELGEIPLNIAKAILEHNGYAIDSLWMDTDLTEHYNCSSEEALNVINSELDNDYIKGEIRASINQEIENKGFERLPEED